VDSRKTKYVGFRVEPEAWNNFCLAAKYYGEEPQELLRQLVYHVHEALKAIQNGQIASPNGDIAAFLTKEFSTLRPEQLRVMAAILASAADKTEGKTERRSA